MRRLFDQSTTMSTETAVLTPEDLGIVQPPPELKIVIDKTADWVARNGEGMFKQLIHNLPDTLSAFENKILFEQKDNAQFGFLRVGNPYFAYYQYRVREVRKEELIAVVGDVESINNAAQEKIKFKKKFLGEDVVEEEVSRSAIQAVKARKKKEFQPAPTVIRAPEPDIWILEKPNISSKQDDIIKLSAQYVARNGRGFQNGLMEREARVCFNYNEQQLTPSQNPMFDFLQPFHPLHGYFKKLVQDYTRVLLPDRETLPKLQSYAANYNVSTSCEYN